VSTEQVLLIVAFLVLPLIQFLLRAARKRQEHQPAQAEGQPPSAGRPPIRERPPAKAHQRMSDAMTAPERKPALHADRVVAPPTRRSTRRGTAVAGLRDPLDVRRAIVLMNVLEPCRAIHSHDSPERDGRI
jgi:hypothetical protein